MSESKSVNSPSPQRSTAYSPLYKQIKVFLLQSLDQGEWKPGEVIPSEFDLAARFQVSQGTVRKAIDELAAENLLIRRQGKGTFVSTHNEAKVRYRFLRLTPDDNHQPTGQSEIIGYHCLKAPETIAALLLLRPADTVINIQRVLSFDNKPTILDTIWLPAQVFKGMTSEAVMQNKMPLYAWFEGHFGVSMVRADESIRAVAANEEAAQRLHVCLGTPLLQVERVAYTYGERPMEVRQGLYITDHFHYRNYLN